MATATERLPVLVTREQKATIAKRAKAAKLTMGEFIRRAAEAYSPEADDAALDGLLEQVRKTTAEAGKALDEALAAVAQSQKRIEQMEAAHAARKAG